MNPPPDGGYPGGNTAEGQAALLNLTSGTFNTAVGLFSLRSNTQNTFNTAVGAGTLLANTADNNTATGAGALLSMLDQCLDLGRDHDIRPLKAGRSTGITDHRHCFLAMLNVAITDHDLRPFASKRQRRRATDS